MGGISSQGLCVSPRTRISRRRQLPVDGEVSVAAGDRVEMDQIVASAKVPGAFHPIFAAAKLGIPPSELAAALTATPGRWVEKGCVIAEKQALFGLIHSKVEAPADGTIESVSDITGQIMFRETPRAFELCAYLPGRVADTDGCTFVEVEAEVCLVQGIFGVGGEVQGRLLNATDRTDGALDATHIRPDDEARILLTPGPVTGAALAALAAAGARGIVAASARGGELMAWTGDTLNPASTGRENLGLTVVLTEGFGHMRMMQRTFDVLSGLHGQPVSMSGTTQIRAGVIRPEVVGMPNDGASNPENEGSHSLAPGYKVRVVRGTAFGQLGVIRAAPTALETIATGAKALVYDLTLDSGEDIRVPRQNVEPTGM